MTKFTLVAIVGTPIYLTDQVMWPPKSNPVFLIGNSDINTMVPLNGFKLRNFNYMFC